MKKSKLSVALTGIFAAIVIQSCGPVVEFFNIDQRVPAEFQVDIIDRSIAVFSSTDALKDSVVIEKERFTSDSLIMLNMAIGLAEGLESNLKLDTGAIKVFNQTGSDRSELDNPSYIKSLSLNSASDLIFVIERLDMGIMQLYKLTGENPETNAGLTYVSLPFNMEVGLYDGFTGNPILRREVADTIYWEVITRMDLKDEVVASRLYSSMHEISKKLGSTFSSRFFDTWLPVERYLYTYDARPWSDAFRFSQEFKWKEAMDIWLNLTDEATPLKRASAAFNLAVALEMMEEYNLALEWLDVAAKNYPLNGIPGYKSILEQKLEKR
ncbi:MAG: DUF6340 family protein [Bacteroidales bacterium]|jgi:tetratricopeptide (TPR) repeat protein|nr:DUF6340 family protein [Bacteroidales bacterium]